MNCKPGDLAVYINGPEEIIYPQWIDHFFEVISRAPDDDEMIVWDVRCIKTGEIGECHDLILRPIRGGETDEQSLEAMRDLMQTKKEKATT